MFFGCDCTQLLLLELVIHQIHTMVSPIHELSKSWVVLVSKTFVKENHEMIGGSLRWYSYSYLAL